MVRILVDMDGVIADFEKGFLKNFRKKYPDKDYITLGKRTTFYVKEQYPKEVQEEVKSIYLAPGFYRSLPAIPGSLEALLEINELGHEVFICTSPLSEYENCVLEKYQWVDEKLGKDWVKKLMITKDKTLIKAEFLIDDKPEIKGAETPVWEHIIYTQQYNLSETSKRRLTWKNWKSVLKTFK